MRTSENCTTEIRRSQGPGVTVAPPPYSLLHLKSTYGWQKSWRAFEEPRSDVEPASTTNITTIIEFSPGSRAREYTHAYARTLCRNLELIHKWSFRIGSFNQGQLQIWTEHSVKGQLLLGSYFTYRSYKCYNPYFLDRTVCINATTQIFLEFFDFSCNKKISFEIVQYIYW